jgi:hypothetical protein
VRFGAPRQRGYGYHGGGFEEAPNLDAGLRQVYFVGRICGCFTGSGSALRTYSSSVAMSGGLSLCELKPLSGFESTDALQDDASQISEITGVGVRCPLNLPKHSAKQFDRLSRWRTKNHLKPQSG